VSHTTSAPSSLAAAITAHLESLTASGYATATVTARRVHLTRFTQWGEPRGLLALGDITPGVLEAYRAHLAAWRTADGHALAWSTHAQHLSALKLLCAWATRTRRLAVNPAAELTLPRSPKRLPRAVLSESEVERVLAIPDVTTPLGLRDRAILELLYSTGLRRRECTTLDLPDVDPARQVVFVREGKGRKDRLVPIGERALAWLTRYLETVRPRLVRGRDPTALFVSGRGTRITPHRLTDRLHRYVQAAGVGKPGSVHIFRHTMATLMHDGGADIRDLQEMLGHAQLSTTQLYTHVAITRLQAVHAKTHPAAHAHTHARASSLAAIAAK
jgi:integrase/recombinase XerD